MNAFNDQQIRERLLHRLDPVQSDGMDEYLFADETFADRLSDARYDLLDDYARGKLSADERARVERHLLSTPTDHHALRVAAALAKIGRAEHRLDRHRARSYPRARRAVWLAAALVIGAVSLLTYDRIVREYPPAESQADLSTLPTMTLLASAQRGDNTTEFDLPHADRLRVQIEVDAPATKTRFTLSIADSNHVVFTARELVPRTSGPYRFVEVAVPSRLLGPGNRRITLAADDVTGAEPSTWDITVNKTD
jgi:hypothetical protein